MFVIQRMDRSLLDGMPVVDPLIKRFEDEDFEETETEEDVESAGQHEGKSFSEIIQDIRITKLTPRIMPKGVHFNISKNIIP